MAKPLPPSFSARVAFEGTYGAAKWANIMWLMTEATGVPGTPDVDALATGMYTQYATHFAPILSNWWHLARCDVTYFPAGTEVVVYGEHQADTPGAVSEAKPASASNAAVVSWIANVYWRGGKPRTYFCGVPAADLDGTVQLLPAFTSSLDTAAAAFISGVNAYATAPFTSVTLSLMSFFSKKAGAARPQAFPITGAKVGSRIDSQRRRLGKELT